MYNTSTTPQTGLFDAKLTVLQTPDPHAVNMTYHFTCAYTVDEPHTGACTLTYRQPATAIGPALITIRFSGVALVQGVCQASEASIVGNYFYDGRQVAAGAYSFRAPAPSSFERK